MFRDVVPSDVLRARQSVSADDLGLMKPERLAETSLKNRLHGTQSQPLHPYTLVYGLVLGSDASLVCMSRMGRSTGHEDEVKGKE